MLQGKVITINHTGLSKVVLLPPASDTVTPNGLVNCKGSDTWQTRFLTNSQ
jgi:hypothetical protein